MRLLGREGGGDNYAAQEPAQLVGGPVRLAPMDDPAAQETVISLELNLLDLVVRKLPKGQYGIIMQSIHILNSTGAIDDTSSAINLYSVSHSDKKVDGKLRHPSVTYTPEGLPA